MLIIFARHSIFFFFFFYIIGLMRNGMGNGGYLSLADL